VNTIVAVQCLLAMAKSPSVPVEGLAAQPVSSAAVS
jgi:hypothetical protein